MRSISAAEDAVLLAPGGRSAAFRVKVKDSGGTFRDLSTYGGQNLCLSANWKEDVDSPGMQADITLKREVEGISLAPLKTASPLNRAFAYPGTYAPLIALAREVQIEVAVVPDGSAIASGDWKLAFHGYIDEVDPGSGPDLQLRCSDLQGKLRDTWIERERSYAFAQGANADRGCIIWRPSDTLVVGERAIPTQAKKFGHFYRVTSITTGITGATEPVWPTGGGSTVVDGGVTWTESGSISDSTGTALETVIQQIVNDNGIAITLEVPSTPSFTLKPFKQDRMSVWDAIRKLADLVVWDLRFKWHAGSSTFKLTLSAPDRAKTTPDRTFTAAQRYPLTRLPTQLQWIRNAVHVVYSDAATPDPAGNAKRKTVVRTDSTSIAAHGRRFCEVAEDPSSPINTGTEAENFADRILSDLANPVAEHECDLPLFRFVELGDLYRWSADGLHYDSDQDLAVTGYTHKLEGGKARTSIQTRGKPSAGMRRWHERFGFDTHALDLDNGNASGPTISKLAVPGGADLSVSETFSKGALAAIYEFHVSDTPSFTPSNSTLVGSGQANEVTVGHLTGGKTYYGVVVPKGMNASRLVRAQPSPEFSFVAGYVEPHHFNPETAPDQMPPNGSFEGQSLAAASNPPDHWEMQTGTWNIDVAAPAGGGEAAKDGARYLRFTNTSVATAIRSKWFPVNGGHAHDFWFWVYRVSMGNSLSAEIEWVTAAKGAISTSTLTKAAADLIDAAWTFVRTQFTAPATAAFARVIFRKASANTDRFHIDGSRVIDLGEPWRYIGDTNDPAFANSWVNYDAANEMKARFRWDRGHCELGGIIKSGTVTAAAWTLPVDYRPIKRVRFPVYSNNASGQVDITAAGDVIPQIGSNVWFDLSPIRFAVF